MTVYEATLLRLTRKSWITLSAWVDDDLSPWHATLDLRSAVPIGKSNNCWQEKQVIVSCIDRTTITMNQAVRRIVRSAAARKLGYRDVRRLWPNCPGTWPLSRRALLLAGREALLVPLQDGLLNATGRLSRRPADSREKARWGRSWTMHSSQHTRIPAEAWQEGRYDWRHDALELTNGHHIEIQLMKIVVDAFWPLPSDDEDAADPSPPRQLAYTTPYLQLMLQAVEEFGIGTGSRPKKEALVDWFRARHVAGQRVSSNMANYLATFIRPPETQRGGNRKWSGTASP